MTRRKDASRASFEKRLKAAGAEILGPTNPYEVLRFRTSKGHLSAPEKIAMVLRLRGAA